VPSEVYPGVALAALRLKTAHGHRSLEALPMNERLLCNDIELCEYRSTLLHLFGFYEPLAILAQQARATWAERITLRVHDLACDLADLELTPHDLVAAPRCAQFPALDSVDRALGGGYVIEGSALGGRVIVRHLHNVFDSHGGAPLRFFSGDGTATAAHWRRFCAELEANVCDVEEVCRAATATFACMAAWSSGAVVRQASQP
jgi:heme oxygenase